MSDEEDIGLYNLSRKPDSAVRTPPRGLRRQSIVSVFKSEEKTRIKSPSHPNLLNGSPKTSTRKLSRSNTLPRQASHRSDASADITLEGLGIVTMESERIERLRRWILALVIVDFDLDYGPKITNVYPALDLTAAEYDNIAFSSFPDSPQSASGSYIHSFRIRQQAKHASEASIGHTTPRGDGFLYGFSHFTQRRDPASKRGYQQRSLVILSQHPYPALFYTLLTYLGQAFLSHGGPMLESACYNIAGWSDPLPGSTLELGFLGYVFTAEIPTSVDAQQSMSNSSVGQYDPDFHILVSLSPQDPPVLAALQASFTHIWSIWECLLLCEPILVFGPSASMTSQVIWWLRDLIRPVPLAGDYRPFFTIHDAEQNALVNPRPPQAGLVLGVTNPFFQRACQHWPHILSLGGATKAQSGHTDAGVGPAPGWDTKTHKRYISRDHPLLKRLEEASKGSDRARMEASEVLRVHFASRTSAFLVPLQRYLNTLIPTPADRSAPPTPTPSSANFHPPSSAAPGSARHLMVQPHLRMKPFNESAFFTSLKANGSPLPFKSNAKRREFYERWLRTNAFGVWLAGQEEVVNRVLAQDVTHPPGHMSLLAAH